MAEAIESGRESARAEQELSAQREMAQWARWLLIVTLGQVPLTALGLVFLLRTIWQGQEANAIARESVEAQIRPWVKIEIDEIIGFRMVNQGANFHVRLKFTNIGSSPAVGLAYFMSMSFGESPKAHLDETIKMFEDGRIASEEANLFPDDLLTKRLSCDHSGEYPEEPIKVGYYAVAAYRTAFSKARRYTALVYEIIDLRLEDGLIDFRQPPHGDNLHLRVDDSFVGYAT